MLGGQAEQGLERGHGRAASVEPEHELVDIAGQVLGADAVPMASPMRGHSLLDRIDGSAIDGCRAARS